MIKSVTIIIIITISISLLAQTQVSGAQSGTWTVDNSPYEVIGEILVDGGQTLTIEAGVEVNFQGHYKFVVEGNLQAIGTETDNIFFTTDNQTIGWGGIRFDNSYQEIHNLSYCRIEFGKTAGNYPDIHGGAVALLSSNAVFSNCIFADNNATGEDNGMGGAVSLAYASANFVNSIIYDNPGMYSDGIYIDFSSSAVINYCDLTMPDGASGSNNIDEDPLFADASNLDFHLTETSPCINAGTDIGLEYFGEAPDVGCFEWEEVSSGNEQIIENYREIKNYPNPFNPRTTILFSLRNRSNVELSIYNIKGQKIKSIIHNELSKGKHSVVWNGDDESGNSVSSGIYYYKLGVDGKNEAVKKCLLLK
jgi:hypothetical protein